MTGLDRYLLVEELETLKMSAIQLQKKCDGIIEKINHRFESKEWLTTSEVAEILGLKPKTVANYVHKGVYEKVRKSGKRNLIHKSELENQLSR